MPGRLEQGSVNFFTIGNEISAVTDRRWFQLLKVEAANRYLYRSGAGSACREWGTKALIFFFTWRMGTGLGCFTGAVIIQATGIESACYSKK